MENIKTWYLKQSQDVRFGIPVIAGMAIALPILWTMTNQPPTCEQAKANRDRIEERRSSEGGSSTFFRDSVRATKELMEACYSGKK